MNRCDAKRNRIGISALTPVERVITLVSNGDYEIFQGGLTTFYYNSSGDYAIETVWALEQIGATQASGVLQKSNSLFGDSLQTDARFEKLRQISEQTQELGQLTSQYYALNPDSWDLLCNYIREHQQDLLNSGILE